jgi:uncharacterized protein (DUF1330 family)
MVFITQVIYIIDGKEELFDEFESLAIPIIKKYNGRLLLRLRLNENGVLESIEGAPYEVHLVEFRSENDFQEFLQDTGRNSFLHLKEQSVRTTLMIKGQKV